MLCCWIDEGGGLDVERCRKAGVTQAMFSLRRHTKAQVDAARTDFQVGGYHALSWSLADEPGLTGTRYADIVNQLTMRMLGGDGKGVGVQLDIQVDIEQHVLPGGFDQWMRDFISRWRAVRANRVTSWALEGFQGGRLGGIRQKVIDAGFSVVPYAYDGDMNPFDTYAVVNDLIAHGFPYHAVRPFYDGRYLWRGADGWVFTQNRLPA